MLKIDKSAIRGFLQATVWLTAIVFFLVTQFRYDWPLWESLGGAVLLLIL